MRFITSSSLSAGVVPDDRDGLYEVVVVGEDGGDVDAGNSIMHVRWGGVGGGIQVGRDASLDGPVPPGAGDVLVGTGGGRSTSADRVEDDREWSAGVRRGRGSAIGEHERDRRYGHDASDEERGKWLHGLRRPRSVHGVTSGNGRAVRGVSFG